MERHDIEWEQLGTHDEHLSVVNYKKEQRVKEVAALEKSISKLQQKQMDVQAVSQIDAKPVPLSSKMILEKEDYQTLITAAQKYIVQEKRESKLEKLLKAAEKTISGLRAKIAELTQELNKYRSVRSQLNIGSLKQENEELRQRNSFYKSVIERHGLSHLLGKRKEQHQARDVIR